MSIPVLCTRNSARSILLEALVNLFGNGRVLAWSAGSHSVGQVHPEALALLTRNGVTTSDLGSKRWELFANPDAPAMDAVVIACCNAASEIRPIWPRAPLSAHWGVEDPVAAPDEDRSSAFTEPYEIRASRCPCTIGRPIESIDIRNLDDLLVRIGETE